MASVTNDLITDTRNAARPNSAKVDVSRSTGVTSLTCDNLTGWPTASAVHFVTYQVDTNDEVVSGTQTDWKGIVSGNTIGTLTLKDGTDNGNSVGDIVEMLPTAAWGQDLANALTSQHTRAGAHSALSNTGGLTNTGGMTTDSLTVSSGTTLPAGDIGTADIAADAVTDAKLIYGKIRSRQGGSSSNWRTAGTTTYNYSATDTFTQTGSLLVDASPKTVTFPTAFSQTPMVFAQVITQTGANCYVIVSAATTTTCDLNVITDSGGANTGQTVTWLAVGE